MASASNPKALEIFVLPWPAPGHFSPLVEMARLFAARGANITFIATAMNAITIEKAVQKDINSGLQIRIQIIPFPYEETGMPQGCENFFHATNGDLSRKLYRGTFMLERPIEKFLRENQPDCFISDVFYCWPADVAMRLQIPYLAFHSTCLFALSMMLAIKTYVPHEKVKSDSEVFVVPGLPDPITITRSQLPDYSREQNEYGRFLDQMRDAELKSYGSLVNGFYELEPAYKHHYESLGTKSFHLGPVTLVLRDAEDKAARSIKAAVDEHECLNWLDSKKPNSVVYVCFGSACRFPAAQLLEIATALEASDQQFMWAVLGKENQKEDEERWLPEGFEKRMKEGNRGMIIRGWAPQILILDHPAIGGFLTHCGYNSVLESASSGVPMITWPLYHEHFYNEKLVTQVLKIGFAVGVEDWNRWREMGKVLQKSDKIEKAITHVMKDEEMRSRAKKIGQTAKAAVKEGGSSYNNLTTLMEELIALREKNKP